MKNVCGSIVENLKKPFILFQSSADDISFEEYTCVQYNKSFKTTFLSDEPTKVGCKLGDFFGTLNNTPKMFNAIQRITSSDEEKVIKITLKGFEDNYIPLDDYCFEFFHAHNSVVIGVESVSHQLTIEELSDQVVQTKEQFVANISHEIRTPLNGILGYIAMLSEPKEQGSWSEFQRNCLEQIRECSMNLLYIMNDILDFSKLNANQMQLRNDPFDIAECLEQSYDIILPGAQEKGLKAAFFVGPEVPPRIKGDFKKLRQVLLNLLSNGVKFTNRGRIDTRVSLSLDDHTGGELDQNGLYTIKFEVEDTGIGILKRDMPKLFKSFSQIDQTNSKVYQGTGLGLIISKKIVQLMGGDITVESKFGEGSKFIFTIKAEEARATSSEASAELLELLKDMSVLVVDDHTTNRMTIASTLVKWGMKPFVCGSPEEALLYMRGGLIKVDFALVDLRMPKMDGNELAQKIKAIEPNLPLISISSSPSATVSEHFNHIIMKPIKTRNLFNICVATVRKLNQLKQQHLTPSDQALPITPTPGSPAAVEKKNVPVRKKLSVLELLDPELQKSQQLSEHYRIPEKPCSRPERQILVVEDLETNQNVITALLEKMGFPLQNVHVCENGRDALELVGKHHFDIILMDLKMPIMNGFEATTRIRKFYKKGYRKEFNEPFIIALTANATSGIRDRCREVGMNAYVSKPINITELAKILDEAH